MIDSAPMQPPPDKLIGTCLGGKYLILEQIGAGGMSIVYKARHLPMDTLVAVKVLHGSRTSGDRHSLERFRQEAAAASSVNHPNVITILDFGIEGPIAYLSMDYLEGAALDEVIRRETLLAPRRVLEIFEQACDALAHAHAQGVVHRDIKPSNIMLVRLGLRQDFVKILDFGIAKVLPGNRLHRGDLTQTGQIFGSPLYMSPEQSMGAAHDHRSDIYSLGCVMYQALCGTPPITGENVLAIIYRHIHAQPAPFALTAPAAEISAEIEALVMKALEKEPAARFQSMSEMRQAVLEAMSTVRDMPVSGVKAAGSGWMSDVPGYSTTIQTFEERLFRAEAELGSDHPSLLPLIEQLAECHKRQDEAEEAVKLYQRAVCLLVERHGRWSAPVADCLFTLAELYMDFGRYDEAEPLLSDVITIKERQPDPGHRDLPFVWQCLGDCFRATGKLVHAEEAYARAVIAAEESFGPDDPAIVASLSRQAGVLFLKRRYNEAADLYRRLLRIYEQCFGGWHQAVAETLVSLGIQLNLAVKHDEAEKVFTRALTIQENVLGMDHPEVARTSIHLADLYSAQGSHVDAELLYQRAIDIRCRHFGADSVETAAAKELLGSYYAVIERWPEAERLYRRAIEIREKLLGAAHPDTAVTLRALCAVLERLERYHDAEQCLVSAMHAMQNEPALDELTLAGTIECLGNLYLNQKRLPEAQAALERALLIKERLLGTRHPALLSTLKILSRVCYAAGLSTQARQIDRRARQIANAASDR